MLPKIAIFSFQDYGMTLGIRRSFIVHKKTEQKFPYFDP